MSTLDDALRDYLGLRRALGHKLAEHERQLTRFAARLDAAGSGFVTMADTLAFVFDPDLDPASTTPAKRPSRCAAAGQILFIAEGTL